MQLEKYINNNQVLIIPNNLKNKTIKYLNSLNKMYNIKIITINELKKNIQFDYNSKTIYHLMNKQNISYESAKELIDNMYYLFEENYDNKKLDNLNKLKNNLLENKLLIINPYFLNSLKNKKVIIYGFDYINRYYQKLINIIKDITDVQIVSKTNNNYSHVVYNFEHINYEIEFIANDILNNRLDFNHVYIYGINKDNENVIKRIFKNYNLNINLPSNNYLYETKIGKDLLSNLDNIDNYLESIKNDDIKNLIINLLNEYYWIDDKSKVKNMLEYELKHIVIPNKKYKNGINITNLFDEYFDDNDFVYIINFNAEYIPKVYKDTDFIQDNEKFNFLEQTYERNIIEKDKWKVAIQSIKNLCITASNQNLNGQLNVSPLVKDFNYKIINKDYIASIFSNKNNIYNLGTFLDEYRKYNQIHKELSTLLATYPNNQYSSYDNSYSKVKLKDDFNYNLSYSKLNTFYECSFKYYCDNILKLNSFEETFDTWAGSLCHEILSKIYNNNFNFEIAKEEFIKNHPFNLTNENKFFLDKILSELQFAIKHIKSFQNITKYQIIETEKNITVNINNINFIGIIDKIMHYNDNIVLVDYKTGTPNIDLRLAKYGLNLQLPTYIYLIKKIYPSSNIIGIYLEHILKPSFNKAENLTTNEQYENSLKLNGYSLGDEEYLQEFDPTYENSNYITGMKLTSNGFSSYAKILTKDNFQKLEKLIEGKIIECINNINEANFDISPKIVGNENVSCDFCPYKSVCYKTEKDQKYLKLDNELSFLGGDHNELD